MSLTIGPGPLSSRPGGDTNYTIDGPKHKLWFEDHPRRIRAEIEGRTILDTVRARLLHESNLLPMLYVPWEDLDGDLFEGPTGHVTHCPFKGDAAYWTLRADERVVVENALWSYPEPRAGAEWLRGWASLYWSAADAWYEEDELVEQHLRDPYHRVDARASSRRVQILAGDEVVADTDRATLVFETGLAVRAYLPKEEVRGELERSETRTICPYKGHASYWSLRLGDRVLQDAAWSYEQPLDDGPRIAGLVSLDHQELEVRIGGLPQAAAVAG